MQQQINTLRENLRAAIEGVQGGRWGLRFPDADIALRGLLYEVDHTLGQESSPLMIDLRAHTLEPTGLDARLREIRHLIRVLWPQRWEPLYSHLEAAEKCVTLAVCD